MQRETRGNYRTRRLNVQEKSSQHRKRKPKTVERSRFSYQKPHLGVGKKREPASYYPNRRPAKARNGRFTDGLPQREPAQCSASFRENSQFSIRRTHRTDKRLSCNEKNDAAPNRACQERKSDITVFRGTRFVEKATVVNWPAPQAAAQNLPRQAETKSKSGLVVSLEFVILFI